MTTLRAALLASLLLTLPAVAHAAPCDAPGWELHIPGGVLFQEGGLDVQIVGLFLPYQPGPAYAIAIDEDGAISAWTTAEVLWPERDGRGTRLKVALKSQRVGEPGYAEFLRAVVCVRRW